MKVAKGTWTGIIVGAVVLLAILSFTGTIKLSNPLASTTPAPGAPTTLATASATTAVLGQSPAYTYSSIDSKQPANSVPGTSYIKTGNQAPVTSLAGPNMNVGLEFWNSNTTNFCDVVDANSAAITTSQAVPDISSVVAPALGGTHTVQSSCYIASNPTLSAYNSPQNSLLTNDGGSQNLSTAVGATNVNLYFQGTSKQSAMPYGGCLALEQSVNVTSISVNGAGITGAPCPFVWSYQVQNTADTFKTYAVPYGFDQNGAADLKSIAIQYTAATNKPVGKAYVAFQPANWYVGNDKAFHLGIEKDANADTTKTFTAGTGMNTTFIMQ